MSVLSAETMERLIESKELVIEPFDKQCLQPASIDLRVGGRVMKSPILNDRGKVMDLAKEKKATILPGQFAAVLTLERLSLPLSICGRMGLRSSYARKGLISFHGTQVDPGFSGHLVVPLVNIGPEPITLDYGQPFGTLELNYLETASSKAYSGDYQDQDDFSLDDKNFILRARMAESRSEILELIQDVGELREMLAQRRPRFWSFITFMVSGAFILVGVVTWRFFEPWIGVASLGIVVPAFIAGILFYRESLRKRK